MTASCQASLNHRVTKTVEKSRVTKKPKILIVATHPIQYQVPWFKHLHTNLTDYQFEVLFLTIPDAAKQGVGFNRSFQWDIPMFDGYCWTNVKAENLNGDLGLENFFSIRLKNSRHLVESIKPNAVLLTGWQCLGLLQILHSCRRLKIPCLIRAESNNLKPRKAYKNVIHRLLLKQYDKYLAIGKANYNFYRSNSVKAEDIFESPYFIDNEFFKNESLANKDQLLELRNKWQLPHDAFCFCYVGKLNTKKRILDVLNALKILDDENAVLIVVGDGDLITQAKTYSKQNNLNVRFTGFLNQSQLPQAYALSHCLILASDYDETWGLVVNEAMACGRPAIVSQRSGCHLDLIQEGITGYSFEFSNCDALSLKMQTIKSLNKHDYQALCRQAQNNVFENYSISNASAGLQNALETIIK